MRILTVILLSILLAACAAEPPPPEYDLVITNGLVYDGSGDPPREMDVAVTGDRIAAILPRDENVSAKRVVDAGGQAVAPGFINVLSWANESLIEDGRGLSDTHQGVTLEIFGEGWTMGPMNDAMKEAALERQTRIRYPIEWTTLGEYLEWLVARGVTPNVASFVGATTIRIHELGQEDVQPGDEQLEAMQELVREAMREGALGVGSSLIYPPAFYAETDELIALAQAAAEFGGGYITHMRSEANKIHEALDEAIAIGRATGERTEVYHLKAAGQKNWPKMAEAIDRIEQAQKEGVDVGANMYTYTAGGTGLTAVLPPWASDGGFDALTERLRDPETRERIVAEMKAPAEGWENLLQLAGGADRLLLLGFENESLEPFKGKTLAEIAEVRGRSPEQTAIDLILEEGARVDTIYFLMSEENVELGLSQPWVALGSDAHSAAPEGVFLETATHPRAYGNFARFLGRYVREKQLVPLTEAIRRMTRMPAETWQLTDRGCLDPGCYADIVVFDPDTITDHATYAEPQQLATGVDHVFVNGVQVLDEGEHTGETPGRVVRGPGYTGDDE
ncbi:N-acyl-D-amino-acid deacylase family protein [Wenzhouxiangella sp. EGI_FJ10305]|uniref:N-acyl-D-amino-acid deacylase family protein n=1 Tax=Wenzhouxiangella sp. EGI_FJ10305 TaxID=3243768 RepID=UPI0035DFFCFB